MARQTSPRIIAGSLKGRHLKSVPGTITRPITDRVKENLFNILSGEIEGCRFLDAFAGTGSVGIEAISRGASFVQFIEKNRLPHQVLSQNLRLVKEENNYNVVKTDALTWLEKYSGLPFDFIYIAPPQYQGIWLDALEAISNNIAILPINSEAIVQIDPKEYQHLQYACFRENDTRKYGNTQLIFYRRII